MPAERQRLAFPLGAEGPYHRLQVALRLAAEDRPNVGRLVVAALVLTWLPLAVLWWLQGEPHSAGEQVPAASLFHHVATYARFLVTIPLLIVAEVAVRPHLEHALTHAVTSGVVPLEAHGRFFELLVSALKRRESKLAELVILGLAFLISHIAVAIAATEHHSSWIHSGASLTWAGIWYAYVSLPVLQFLIFRWIYRLSIWWQVMSGMAKLDLQIQPAHPDQRGGLAFIGDSVQAFAILALAFGAAAAGAVTDFVLSEGAPITELKGFIAGAALFVLFLFLGPLFFFFRPLYRAKDEALLHYEGLAERFWQAFDRKWVQARCAPWKPEDIAQPDFSAAADLANVVRTVREMKLIPFTKEGVLPLLIAIALPFIPALSAAVPIQDLLTGIVHVFLGKAE